MNCCLDCPRRFFVVFLGFFGLLLSIGYRMCFALVMTHVVFRNTSQHDEESLFPSCSTRNTTRDLVLHWDVSTVFLMHTSYFCGSLVTQLPGGVLAQRFSSKRVCGVSILISSVLFIVIPFAVTYNQALVFVIRIVQGLVEGCSVPALNGVISAWAPKTEKGRLITIAYAGAYLSPAVGLITTGACVCYVSWNSIFFIYGGCGVVWAFLWLLCVYDTPKKHPGLGPTETRLFDLEGHHIEAGDRRVMQAIPWRAILTSMPVYAIIAGAFCRNWIFSMLITQQPQFFRDVFNMKAADIGLLSAVPHVLMTTVVIIGGVVVDKLIKHGIFSTTVARKLSESVGFGVEAICVLVIAFTDGWKKAFTLLCVGVGMSGFAISGYQVNPLDLAPQFASVLTGLARLGTLGAILSTVVASRIHGDNTLDPDDLKHRWEHLFIIAASIHLAGVVFYAVFASGERQSWAGASSTLTVNFNTPASSDYEEASRETERLLRQRLRHRRPNLLDDDDDYGSTTRFLNTI